MALGQPGYATGGTPLAVSRRRTFLFNTINIFIFAGVFEDEDVTHVEGDVDPIRDLEIIHEELRKKDEEYIK